MKRSEKLMQEAHAEDNDMAFMRKEKQARRVARLELFEESWLPEFELKYDVTQPSEGHFVIDTGDGDWGIVDFYPMADKACIRNRQNLWINRKALEWLVKRLLI